MIRNIILMHAFSCEKQRVKTLVLIVDILNRFDSKFPEKVAEGGET